MGEYYHAFSDEDMAVDEGLGYPRAYARICRDHHVYKHGPPSTFTPYTLQETESTRVKELENMFPVIDPKARPTSKPKIFLNILWKQLNHLGNAGFDPNVIRVDPYGNVLYYHADSASPLAWQIDHWFPCSRGGLTVPSNLRILQWQVYKKKHNKLEFLVPWWDLQLGVSVNQFLSIFAASNSEFRRRAFCFLFKEGESEELNESQTVESHCFPRHYVEAKEQFGLAPAAIVRSQRESFDPLLPLRSLDYNGQSRPQSSASAARRIKSDAWKENEAPDFVTNPYKAIVMARDSLRQREEAQKMQSEIKKLDEEVTEMRKKNEEEKITIQELELELIKRRRRAEKCRKLADAQSSYRTMLEKMIRDAMHQSVVYKEQIRLNQAATNALTARLEAQKAICDSSERELHKKFKKKDELEKAIRYDLELARKRSRTDQELSCDCDNSVLYLTEGTRPIHKELRVFLEEEQKASESEVSRSSPSKMLYKNEQVVKATQKELAECDNSEVKHDEKGKELVVLGDDKKMEPLDQGRLGVKEKVSSFRFLATRESEVEEDEENRIERGKGNVEKWLQLLLENNTQEEQESRIEKDNTDEVNTGEDIVKEMHPELREKEQKPDLEDKGEKSNQEGNLNAEVNKAVTKTETPVGGGSGRRSYDFKEGRDGNGKEKELKRTESARAFRRIPSSPSLILKKGVDCMRKKPMVMGDDDDDEDLSARNNFLRSIKTIKKAVKF